MPQVEPYFAQSPAKFLRKVAECPVDQGLSVDMRHPPYWVCLSWGGGGARGRDGASPTVSYGLRMASAEDAHNLIEVCGIAKGGTASPPPRHHQSVAVSGVPFYGDSPGGGGHLRKGGLPETGEKGVPLSLSPGGGGQGPESKLQRTLEVRGGRGGGGGGGGGGGYLYTKGENGEDAVSSRLGQEDAVSSRFGQEDAVSSRLGQEDGVEDDRDEGAGRGGHAFLVEAGFASAVCTDPPLPSPTKKQTKICSNFDLISIPSQSSFTRHHWRIK
jgi:hypothetical protein